MFVLVASLICCIVYYFYYVFSTAIYSRIIIESPSQRVWPTTIVCEKQAFTFSKIAKVRVSLSQYTEVHFASLLFGGFITAIVVNQPERELAKRTSVQ